MDPSQPGKPFSDTDVAGHQSGNRTERELDLGDKLGRFEIVRKLGDGGMGIVYVALDPLLNRQIAVKLLKTVRSRPLAAKAARGRLIREAQAMAKLSHPNVITVHEVGIVDEQVFIVMELNDGETLGAWIKQPRDWRTVISLFVQAGRGLRAAHEAGLIHRDFKPDNVLIGRDGRVRVTDFGLVDSSENVDKVKHDGSAVPRPSEGGMLAVALTQTGALLGTPPYMAPEQHEAVDADARTDQYSFCVSLFEALYGYRPFHGDNYRALVLAILDGDMRERPANTEVPDSLHQIILRGLCVDRTGRFESMDELLKALSRFIDGTNATPDGGAWRAPSPMGKEEGNPRGVPPTLSKEKVAKEKVAKEKENYRGWWVAGFVFVALGGLTVGWVALKGDDESTPSSSLLDSSDAAAREDIADPRVLLSRPPDLVVDAGVVDAGVTDGLLDANEARPPRRSATRRGPRKKRDPDQDTPPVKTNSPPEMSAAKKAAERRRRELNLDLKGTTP